MKFVTVVLVLLLLVGAVMACDTDYNPFMINNGVHNVVTVATTGVSGSSQMTGYNAPDNSENLGTVTFITGKLIQGNLTATKLLQGGTFSSGGSTFTIVGNGTNGVPNGAIFTGSFNGLIKWEYTNTLWKTYALLGNVKGKLIVNGEQVQAKGNTAQLFTYNNGTFTLVGGLTNLYY